MSSITRMSPNTLNVPEIAKQAIMMRNEVKVKILLHGFIKECYKNITFKDMTNLPLYLIDYILKFLLFYLKD